MADIKNISQQFVRISAELNKLELKGFANCVTLANVGLWLNQLEDAVNDLSNKYEATINRMKYEAGMEVDTDNGRAAQNCNE